MTTYSQLSKRLLAAAASTLLFAGCAATVVTTAGLALYDRRSPESYVDDTKIEVATANGLNNDSIVGRHNHIKTISYNGTLLLAGEVNTDQQKSQAGKVANKIHGVYRVVNELGVMPPTGIGRRSKDTWLTSKVKASFLKVEVETFDPTRVKVVTVRSVVYLMGMVSDLEAEQVVDQTRRIRGVKKVVKIFERYAP